MTKRPHILLVEDHRMDVELILDVLRGARLGTTVHVARDGREALDYLFGRREYADRQTYPLPDLTLLDLKLPGIDGPEVLREVKGAPGLRSLPVVILTSSNEEADRALSYEIGANSYLVKPTSHERFVEVVRQIQDYWLVLNVGPPEWQIKRT